MFTIVSLIVNGTLSRPTTVEPSNRQRTFCVGLVKSMIMANQNPGLFSLTAGIHTSLTDILLQEEAMMKVRSCIFVLNVVINHDSLCKNLFFIFQRPPPANTIAKEEIIWVRIQMKQKLVDGRIRTPSNSILYLWFSDFKSNLIDLILCQLFVRQVAARFRT